MKNETKKTPTGVPQFTVSEALALQIAKPMILAKGWRVNNFYDCVAALFISAIWN